MMMNPKGRKFLPTLHITVSVGWIGVVLAYLALVIAAMLGQSDQLLHAAWIALELIGWYIIVPLALAALITGISIALGTPWGLFRPLELAITLFTTLSCLRQWLVSQVSLASGAGGDGLA
jgi:hypothetical protein